MLPVFTPHLPRTRTHRLAAGAIATAATTRRESLPEFLGDPLFVGMLPRRPGAVKWETPYLLTCQSSKAA